MAILQEITIEIIDIETIEMILQDINREMTFTMKTEQIPGVEANTVENLEETTGVPADTVQILEEILKKDIQEDLKMS